MRDGSSTLLESFTYDDNGNRTSVTYSSGTDTFDYDWNNRLTEATVGGSTVEYGYGPDNLRTSRTESSLTETYLWDRLTALPTMVSDGTTDVVHGPTGAANEITGSAASYPLPDGLGSNRVWTNASGVATGSAEWDAWGNLRSSSGSQGLHRWTGERQDPTSNLVYLRARDFSPGTGRFSQPDPIQPNDDSPQGHNGYWYANNNPTLLTDPAGLSAGQINANWYIAAFFAGGMTSLAYGGVAVGTAAVLMTLGAFVVWGLIFVVLLFLIMQIVMETIALCEAHGCGIEALTGAITGWIEAQITSAGTTIKSGIDGIVSTVAITCLLATTVSAAILPIPVSASCNSDPGCALERIEEPVELLYQAHGGDQIEIPSVFGSSGQGGSCDPTPCSSDSSDSDGETKGGVYKLVDGTGETQYVGRTNDFERRKKEHKRKWPHLELVPVYYTDDYVVQRGLEQILYQLEDPPLNKRNPIWPKNPRKDIFMGAANKFLGC